MNSHRRRKIVINGWYGNFNAGDDAILDVFVEQAGARLNCDITVFAEQPANIPSTDRVRAEFHLPASFRSMLQSFVNGDFFRHLNVLKKADLFVLGGGGLLRDNTSWRNLISLLDEIWLSKMLGKKVMLYAIGVGPFKSRLGKYLIGKSVRKCDLVTVRNARDAQLLKELGVPAERINVVSDPAFLLSPTPPEDRRLIDMLAGGRKIGVFPALGLVDDGRDFSHALQLAAALDQLVERHGLQFVALPMRVREAGLDDVEIANRIRAAMKHPEALEVYEKRLTPSELKWATAQTRMNITVRLHAMIFSLGAHVPVVAVNYEPKVANVFAEFGCPEYLVEMNGNLEQGVTAAVGRCLENRPAYADKIARGMIEREKSALRTFELMQALYEEAPALAQTAA